MAQILYLAAVVVQNEEFINVPTDGWCDTVERERDKRAREAETIATKPLLPGTMLTQANL